MRVCRLGKRPGGRTLRLCAGFTLIEAVLGVLVIVAVVTAILGAYVGQITLNEHARNLSLAIHDANRVIEQIRQQNAGCAGSPPSIAPPSGGNWDGWLGAGKSIQPNPTNNELIVVTCHDSAGASCGTGGARPQVGTEWTTVAGATTIDPLTITVAVCWRHRNRIIGECSANGVGLQADDAGVVYPGTDTAGVVESPAMLTTLVTCRG